MYEKQVRLYSILDNDMYKFTMQQAVLEQFPNTRVRYVFNNRNLSMKFTKAAIEELTEAVQEMRCSPYRLDDKEHKYLASLGIFKPAYLEYLKNYKYNPAEVSFHLDKEKNLQLTIEGLWHRTILWEVPLMALISQIYFKYIDTKWSMDGQEAHIREKALDLANCGCQWADFGTRRRRNFETQALVVETMKGYSGFVGTSNVHLAMQNNVRPIGTMAHEWIMGVSALRGLRHANHNALYCWIKTYQADLGIALTDTFGSESFFEDFDLKLAKTFDGVRHDSGDPFAFTDRVIAHYQKLRIDPATKTIVFSDGLDTRLAQTLARYCREAGIRASFGIGTFLTNDFKDPLGAKSKPLNMVIKLNQCDGIPVVKLSDNPIKAIGDRDALRVAKWTFFNTPLDAEV